MACFQRYLVQKKFQTILKEIFSKKSLKEMWSLRDSNPRPSACKADALNQLSYGTIVEVGSGLEPL